MKHFHVDIDRGGEKYTQVTTKQIKYCVCILQSTQLEM